MDNQFVANFIEIDGGALSHCVVRPGLSTFTFESGLKVEAYSGWIITRAFGFGGKEALIGSRDIEEIDDQTSSIQEHLSQYELKVLVLNRGGLFQLQFLNEEGDRVSIDLLADSIGKKNWEVIASDGVLNNLNTTIEKFGFA